MTFSLNPPECHMEIRYGFDLRGREVAGPVRVGEPLTLVIYMKSEYGMIFKHLPSIRFKTYMILNQ